MARTITAVSPSALEDLQSLRAFYASKLDAARLPANPSYWPSWAIEARRWIRGLDAGIRALRRARTVRHTPQTRAT